MTFEACRLSAALVSGKTRTDESTTVCLLRTLLAILRLIRPLAGINNTEAILFVFVLFAFCGLGGMTNFLFFLLVYNYDWGFSCKLVCSCALVLAMLNLYSLEVL